jgi:hypothetical protein
VWISTGCHLLRGSFADALNEIERFKAQSSIESPLENGGRDIPRRVLRPVQGCQVLARNVDGELAQEGGPLIGAIPVRKHCVTDRRLQLAGGD